MINGVGRASVEAIYHRIRPVVLAAGTQAVDDDGRRDHGEAGAAVFELLA